MKKASDLKELYRVLIPNEPLTKDLEEFYVPIFDKKIAEIRTELSWSELKNHTEYISGQSGSGKTTALNFLPDDDILDNFEVIHLYANNLFDLNDIDIVDFLLMICFKLMKEEKSLQRKFKSELEKIKGHYDGTLESHNTTDAGMKGEVGVGAKVEGGYMGQFLKLFSGVGIDFFVNYRADASYRKLTRKAFSFSKQELLNLTNKIIHKFLEKKNTNKQLLFLINELDHMKKADLISKLFMDDLYFIENLECKKVISVPVILKTMNSRRRIHYFGLKVKDNPLNNGGDEQEDEVNVEDNKKVLREIISSRVKNDATLITADALELAIELSGGILRQFMYIIKFAAVKVGRSKQSTITKPDIKAGADRYRPILEGPIVSKDKIDVLKHIMDKHTPEVADKDILITTLLGNQTILYENGIVWYDVNPLIQNTVRIYAGAE